MRNRFRIILSMLLIASSVSVIANEDASVVFSASERQTIQQYFAPAPAPELPPGMVFNNASLKKKKLLEKKQLPPGLAAQVQKNGTLPADLEKKLPAVPAGYERAVLDDLTIVLIEVATNRIIDLVQMDDAKSKE